MFGITDSAQKETINEWLAQPEGKNKGGGGDDTTGSQYSSVEAKVT